MPGENLGVANLGVAPVMGRSAIDGVGEKAPPSVSAGLRGSKKMCRFGVSGVAAPVSFPNDTSWPHVTRPGVYVARPGAGPGAGAGAGA